MKILFFITLMGVFSCTVVKENTYVYDSAICDTISDIDLLFDSVDKYREYLGVEPQDNILIRRLK